MIFTMQKYSLSQPFDIDFISIILLQQLNLTIVVSTKNMNSGSPYTKAGLYEAVFKRKSFHLFRGGSGGVLQPHRYGNLSLHIGGMPPEERYHLLA